MDDQSYVSTMVLENRMQASMAESSYSQTDIAAAAYVAQPCSPMPLFPRYPIPLFINVTCSSGSFWGFGASVGGELGLSSSQAASGDSETSSKQVTISYNVWPVLCQ